MGNHKNHYKKENDDGVFQTTNHGRSNQVKLKKKNVNFMGILAK